MEHRLGEWLDATARGAPLPLGPGLRGARWRLRVVPASRVRLRDLNADLDRAVLFGTAPGHEHVLDIGRGYWA